MTGVFSIRTLLLRILFSVALPITDHIQSPAYYAIYDTPLINKRCLELSEKRQDLFRSSLYDYMCICIETGSDAKFFIEKTANLIIQLKDAKSPLIKTLSETFAKISKYLEAEFSKQDQIIKLLVEKATATSDDPLSKFVINNKWLSLDELYTKYAAFLTRHLIQKFRSDFKKLKTFNIPRILRNDLDFINCQGKYAFKDRDFTNIPDVIKKINGRMMGIVDSMVKLNGN